MRAIFKYIFLTARRDFFFLSLVILLIIIFIISLFLGELSLVEQKMTSIALIAGSSRTILVIGFSSFVSVYIKRIIDTKELQFILATPLVRSSLIISLFGSFSSLALSLVALLASGLLSLLGSHSFAVIALWSVSLLTEICVIISVALALALILESAVSTILFSLAFYVLARLNGYLISFAHNPAFETNLPGPLQIVCTSLLKFIGLFLPRLDLATQTIWLLYPIENYKAMISANLINIIFSLLFLGIAINDLQKKEL